MFAQLVSDNYFEMLGVGMELGRPLLPGDSGVTALSALRVYVAADRKRLTEVADASLVRWPGISMPR